MNKEPDPILANVIQAKRAARAAKRLDTVREARDYAVKKLKRMKPKLRTAVLRKMVARHHKEM